MSGGNFLYRVISYVMNEVVVNSLANSPAFQRFAVRSSKKMEELTEKALKKKEGLADHGKQVTKIFEELMQSQKNRRV